MKTIQIKTQSNRSAQPCLQSKLLERGEGVLGFAAKFSALQVGLKI